MKTIGELKQNSPEWHTWRKEGIGASEANIIMGTSKNISPLMLFNSKVHDIEIDNSGAEFIFAKGHRLEAKSRPLFEMEMFSDFPDMIAVSAEFDFIRASLDGYSEELNACWECKFCGQEDFETVKNGGILEHYYPQLQHQLLVTGADKNYLYVITDDHTQIETSFPYKTAYVEVKPDLEYMKNELLPALLKFWDNVTKAKAPKMSDLDTVNLDGNEQLTYLLRDYKVIKATLDRNKKKEEDLKKEIYKIAKHSKNICNGVKITKSKSEDSDKPDYERYCSDKNLDIIELGYFKIQKGRITKRITFPKSDQ